MACFVSTRVRTSLPQLGEDYWRHASETWSLETRVAVRPEEASGVHDMHIHTRDGRSVYPSATLRTETVNYAAPYRVQTITARGRQLTAGPQPRTVRSQV
jgi:hypothetical protein